MKRRPARAAFFLTAVGSVNHGVFGRLDICRAHAIAGDKLVRPGGDRYGRAVQHIPGKQRLGQGASSASKSSFEILLKGANGFYYSQVFNPNYS